MPCSTTHLGQGQFGRLPLGVRKACTQISLYAHAPCSRVRTARDTSKRPIPSTLVSKRGKREGNAAQIDSVCYHSAPVDALSQHPSTTASVTGLAGPSAAHILRCPRSPFGRSLSGESSVVMVQQPSAWVDPISRKPAPQLGAAIRGQRDAPCGVHLCRNAGTTGVM